LMSDGAIVSCHKVASRSDLGQFQVLKLSMKIDLWIFQSNVALFLQSNNKSLSLSRTSYDTRSLYVGILIDGII
jgi:hypothetical protein